jgi:hypothetical protein
MARQEENSAVPWRKPESGQKEMQSATGCLIKAAFFFPLNLNVFIILGITHKTKS